MPKLEELPVVEEPKEEVKPTEEPVKVVKEVKEAPKKKGKEEAPRDYKGYDIKWLRSEDQVDHPDRHLVDEFDKKYGKVEK